MTEHIENVERAVTGLPEYERQNMERTFMIEKAKLPKDKDLFNGGKGSLPFGKTEYYDQKEQGMLRIGFALCIEVYDAKRMA